MSDPGASRTTWCGAAATRLRQTSGRRSWAIARRILRWPYTRLRSPAVAQPGRVKTVCIPTRSLTRGPPGESDPLRTPSDFLRSGPGEFCGGAALVESHVLYLWPADGWLQGQFRRVCRLPGFSWATKPLLWGVCVIAAKAGGGRHAARLGLARPGRALAPPHTHGPARWRSAAGRGWGLACFSRNVLRVLRACVASGPGAACGSNRVRFTRGFSLVDDRKCRPFPGLI